jgi:hypothetical protein
MWQMQKMQEQFSTKEKYPKENPPAAAYILRFSFSTGAYRRHIPVPR